MGDSLSVCYVILMPFDPEGKKPVQPSVELCQRQLGDFKILRPLGAGGMADVYLAEQTSLNRMVAIKILRPEAVEKKTLLQRFQREAQTAGGLTDSSIVPVYLIGETDGLHYIVQEYVPGMNLSQWFRRNGPPDFSMALRWMTQVATALKVASAAGIVHRDIKPENIMLTRSNDAKVTDFGLAQLSQTDQKMNLTQDGTTMGTPWYMSPEQIQGEKLDHRTDQYSFGVTCYHMLTGQPPFPGRNPMAVAVSHLKDAPPSLSVIRRDLPDAMCDVVHRMLEKKPEDRFEDAEATLAAIANLEKLPVKSPIDTSSFAAWFRCSLPNLQTALVATAISLIVAVIVGRQLFRPVTLELKPTAFKQESSAGEQYARALLQARNPSAWQAVYQYYPKSEEALYARLQLGLHYLAKDPPDFRQAMSMFENLNQEAASRPADTKRQLQFLSLLGQAMTLDATIQQLTAANPEDPEIASKKVRYNEIVNSQLDVDFWDELRMQDIAAPQRMQEFLQRLISDLL
ncbi:MAG: serine/threonine-protein kinase [Fuerstiella sp.]